MHHLISRTIFLPMWGFTSIVDRSPGQIGVKMKHGVPTVARTVAWQRK